MSSLTAEPGVRADVVRKINILPDGTAIDIEIFTPPQRSAVLRLVSERARALWSDRRELSTLTAGELSILRPAAQALGFVVHEPAD